MATDSTILRDLIAFGLATVALATILGVLANKAMGVLLLGLPAAVAFLLCCLGFRYLGWAGLGLGVLASAALAYWLGSRFGRRRGGFFMSGLWLGYCTACAVGYWAAEWVGWLGITLPTLILFWYSLWRLSGRILPIEIRTRPRWLRRYLSARLFHRGEPEEQMVKEARQRVLAFRSLVSFCFGTNSAYHAIDDGELQTAVEGNPYGQFLAGPGIVLTEPHQAVVISDGMTIKGIARPGLVFTGLFDTVNADQIVDLRTQLRAFDVEAMSADGIRMRVSTLVSFRIRRASASAPRFWAGRVSSEAIFEAMRTRPVEGLQNQWDDLAPIVAGRVLREIISGYRCNELCAGDRPEWLSDDELPHVAIATVFRNQLRTVMAATCSGIEIVGAWIAGPEPVDPEVRQWRIENWRTAWTRRMAQQVSEGATEAARLMAHARAQGQAEVIRILTEEAEDLDVVDREMLADVLTLRLLHTLEDMSRSPAVQQLLPPEATATMEFLRRTVERGQRLSRGEDGA